MAGESEIATRGEGAVEAADDAAARSPFVDELREGRTPPTLAAAILAWALTLAPSGFGRGEPWIAGVLSVAALLAGVAGPIVRRARPRLGRHVGITLFLFLATATWLVGSQAIHPLRLEPIRGAFGAVAWGVFALSWSDRWSSRVDPVPLDPEAPLLLPRAALPALAVPITTVGVGAALLFLVLAFRAREPERALVTQAAALACAVAVVTSAGTVAIARGKSRPPSGRRLTPAVVRMLLLLVTVAIAGAVLITLRS